MGVGARVQVSVGTAWDASGNFNNASAKGNSKQVNQQSGLFAGDGGYHVKADHVDLQGGAIASTASKESNNLTANSLTFSNIQEDKQKLSRQESLLAHLKNVDSNNRQLHRE